MNAYLRFGAMILTAVLVMFALTYLNSFQADHLYFSETRAYMTLLMGASMAVIMLAYMRAGYRKRGLNAAIFIGSAIVFAAALWLVRSQARISDPRVRELADQIIEAQREEIALMKRLIEDLESRDSGDGGQKP